MAVNWLSLKVGEQLVTGEVEEVVTGEVEEVVIGKVKELVTGKVDKVVIGKVEEVVTGDMEALGASKKEPVTVAPVTSHGVDEEVVAGLDGTGHDDHVWPYAAYHSRIEKEKAAMRKQQKRSYEGGWMTCASCRKRGSLRCAACIMTTYCSLDCHVKDWGEGHRARCREVRKEFVEVVLDPWEDDSEDESEDEGEDECEDKDECEDEDETKPLLYYFTLKVEETKSWSKLLVYNNYDDDNSVLGELVRSGQEEVYDKIKKVVEEKGYVEDPSDFGEGFVKFSTACFYAHFKGKTEDGGTKLKINVKRVQPMVMW